MVLQQLLELRQWQVQSLWQGLPALRYHFHCQIHCHLACHSCCSRHEGTTGPKLARQGRHWANKKAAASLTHGKSSSAENSMANHSLAKYNSTSSCSSSWFWRHIKITRYQRQLRVSPGKISSRTPGFSPHSPAISSSSPGPDFLRVPGPISPGRPPYQLPTSKPVIVTSNQWIPEYLRVQLLSKKNLVINHHFFSKNRGQRLRKGLLPALRHF